MCISQVLKVLGGKIFKNRVKYIENLSLLLSWQVFENGIFVALSEIVSFTNLLCCGKPKYYICYNSLFGILKETKILIGIISFI